jgi:Uma2 family endonuclease
MGARAFAAKVLRPEPMTLEAWGELDEPGELVDSVLLEEEVPSNLHETIVAWLLFVLKSWALPRRALVFGSEHKIAVSKDRGRKPDVCMYPPGLRLGAYASISRKTPALIAEVTSGDARDFRRDRLEKMHEYARLGVRSYWLLNPEARTLEILNLGPDGHYSIACVASEGVIDVPGFEGLSVDISALWSEVDTLLTEESDPPPESGRV